VDSDFPGDDSSGDGAFLISALLTFYLSPFGPAEPSDSSLTDVERLQRENKLLSERLAKVEAR
jgi:hypothetical protein